LSTTEAERAIRDGRVRVDGKGVRQPLKLVSTGALVTVDGGPVSLETRGLALVLPKPKDAVTSRSEPTGARTVFDVLLPQLPPDLRRHEWRACGRLDRDTTGLLVFTNDGRLVEHLTSPDRHLPKRYRALVQGTVTPAQVQRLLDGVELAD